MNTEECAVFSRNINFYLRSRTSTQWPAFLWTLLFFFVRTNLLYSELSRTGGKSTVIEYCWVKFSQIFYTIYFVLVGDLQWQSCCEEYISSVKHVLKMIESICAWMGWNKYLCCEVKSISISLLHCVLLSPCHSRWSVAKFQRQWVNTFSNVSDESNILI